MMNLVRSGSADPAPQPMTGETTREHFITHVCNDANGCVNPNEKQIC